MPVSDATEKQNHATTQDPGYPDTVVDAISQQAIHQKPIIVRSVTAVPVTRVPPAYQREIFIGCQMIVLHATQNWDQDIH